MDGLDILGSGNVEGTVRVSSVVTVGVTDDSVKLDTVEIDVSVGMTIGDCGRDGAGMEGVEVAGRLGGDIVDGERTNDICGLGVNSNSDRRLETVAGLDNGRGISSGSTSPTSLSGTNEGMVRMLPTSLELGSGLLRQWH